MTDEEKEQAEEIRQEYLTLCHAMQTGIAAMMNYDELPTTPKHLRVGVNCAMVEHAATVGLLVAKGIITDLEYFTALRDKMKEEVESYEKLISDRLGGKTIHLG